MRIHSVLTTIIVTGILFACTGGKLSESDIEELFAQATSRPFTWAKYFENQSRDVSVLAPCDQRLANCSDC